MYFLLTLDPSVDTLFLKNSPNMTTFLQVYQQESNNILIQTFSPVHCISSKQVIIIVNTLL